MKLFKILRIISYSIHIILWGVITTFAIFKGLELSFHPTEFGIWVGRVVDGIVSVIR